MLRVEPKLDGIAKALDRLTRAAMLDVIARPDSPLSAKRMAQEILDEMPKANGGTR